MPRRSLVFLISDFISTPGWAMPLAQMSRRHEVVAVRLYDPVEQELPEFGLAVVQDAETGEQMFVDTRDRGFRKRYAEAAGARGGDHVGARQRRGRRAGACPPPTISWTRYCASRICAGAASQLAAGGSLPAHLGLHS